MESYAMPRRIAWFLILPLCAGLVPQLCGQDQGDLTPDEVQQIRDNAINPNDRIKLFIKFDDERIDELKQLAGGPKDNVGNAQVRDKLEEFTSLCDELQDNVDTYDSAHADIRKSLKDVIAATARWSQAINALPPSPNYEFSQKTALDSVQSAQDDAKQVAREQGIFFQIHKKMRGRNGSAPD